MKKPEQLNKDQIDLEELKNICQEYIDLVDNDDEYHEDSEYDHYIFEEAMKAIFGKNVFDYINNRQS